VIGIRGVCNDECIVVKSVSEAMSTIDFTQKTVLFSQTTMDKATFYDIKVALEEHIKELVVDTMENIATEFHAKDTICGQVSGRETQLIKFAKENDIIIFVAGRTSSNGKVLYDVAKGSNEKTYFVEDSSELLPEWFNNVESVGITGATSTPQWYMEQVREEILEKYSLIAQ